MSALGSFQEVKWQRSNDQVIRQKQWGIRGYNCLDPSRGYFNMLMLMQKTSWDILSTGATGSL